MSFLDVARQIFRMDPEERRLRLFLAQRYKSYPPPSQGRGAGSHTRLWLELSWCLGDEHADRICWMIDVYVRVMNLRGRSWR